MNMAEAEKQGTVFGIGISYNIRFGRPVARNVHAGHVEAFG